MIITPSHTPKRDHSTDRGRASLTEVDMKSLYRKLEEVDQTGAFDKRRGRKSRAIEKERRGIRVLTKSMSVDNTGEDDNTTTVTRHASRTDDVTTQPNRSKRYAAIAKIHSGLFDDAPLSSSLPASIVIGELVITPGAKSLHRKARKLTKQRSGSASPKTARRQFFGQASASPVANLKSFLSWPKRVRNENVLDSVAKTKAHDDVSDDDMSESGSDDDEEEDDDSKSEASSQQSTSASMEIPDERKSRPGGKSLLSSLLSIAKTKRTKMFRRAKSVEGSKDPQKPNVSSTVVRAGVSSMSPAAPSTYKPPELPKVTSPSSMTSSASSSGGRFMRAPSSLRFRRAASVDASELFATTPQTQSNVVTSIIAQRQASLSSSSTSSTATANRKTPKDVSIDPFRLPNLKQTCIRYMYLF